MNNNTPPNDAPETPGEALVIDAARSCSPSTEIPRSRLLQEIRTAPTWTCASYKHIAAAITAKFGPIVEERDRLRKIEADARDACMLTEDGLLIKPNSEIHLRIFRDGCTERYQGVFEGLFEGNSFTPSGFVAMGGKIYSTREAAEAAFNTKENSK
jgi:hypothetical protein